MAPTAFPPKQQYIRSLAFILICGIALIRPAPAEGQSALSRTAHSANALRSMARVYMAVGEYAKAQPLAEQAVALARSGGVSDAELSLCMIDLAWLHREQARLADAEKMCIEGLELQEKAYGRDHPYVAYTLRILASVYQDSGKYRLAAPVLDRAMAIMQASHGSDDHVLAGFCADIATLLTAQGSFAEAEAYYSRAMDLINKSYGPNHLYTAGVLGHMAKLYVLQARFAEAETLTERALKTQQEVYGSNHHALTSTWLTIARIHLAGAD
ncbi:MAG: tetratricopeptide repeat protein, partial [Planctomycetota bacterium]